MVFSFHCSLHYDTECGLGEEEYLKTFSEARKQDILGKDQMKPSPRILIKHHLQRSPSSAWLQPRHTLLTVFTLKTSIHKSVQNSAIEWHQNLLRYENSEINGLSLMIT